MLPGLPGEVWERIAFYSVACEDTFLGPPADICSILLTCRWLYQVLNFQSNPGFYARLFRFKFDYDAPLRRLGMQWLSTRHLATELKKRMQVLKRVRRREEYSLQDLWTCYLMMSENDGCNERQLVEWARLYPYLQRAASMRFESEPGSSANWFSGSEETSLILWLWWMIFSRENLRLESPHIQNILVRRLLHGFLVKGFQYPSCYGPESHFHLPLMHGSDVQAWSTSPLPRTTEIIHYSLPITISSPLLNSGSLLTWISRMETMLENTNPITGPLANLPVTREEANARNIPGPTQEDFLRAHRNQVHAPERCNLNIQILYDDEENFCTPEHPTSRHGSRRYDEDWYRMVSCCDPWETKPLLRGPVHRPGSLTGSWAGTFLQTSHDVHLELTTNPRPRSIDSVTLFQRPLYFNLREHHCLHPDEPLDVGINNLGEDDLLNAWLPNDLRITEAEQAIEIYDPHSKRTVRYETYVPGTSYSKAACAKLRKAWIHDEEVSESEYPDSQWNEDPSMNATSQTTGDRDQPPRLEESDEYMTTVSHLDSGIADILITGETGEGPGNAWGHFNIIGRVRPWDGYIILLRTPRDQQNADLGKWIFSGYVHDHNLVGRWRETSTAARLVGYGGPFVAKIDLQS